MAGRLFTPALVALGLALSGCGDGGTPDPRVARLETDLTLARERVAMLERDLAGRVSREAEAELARMRLEKAEARVAELEAGPAAAPAAAVDPAEARRRFGEAMAALRALDARLARLAPAIAAAEPDGAPPRDALREIALALAGAARAAGVSPEDDGSR